MMRFLKDRENSVFSDLYEEILKPNMSHTNRIIQIVPCKPVLIQLQNDLYRRIYKGERFIKTFCSNWRHDLTYDFLCKQYLARLNLERAKQKMNYIRHEWSLVTFKIRGILFPRTENTLPLRKAKEPQVAGSREKNRER